MWSASEVTRRLGIQYPLIQGPFGGGFSTPGLAIAASNAGALGSYGAHSLPPDDIARTIREIRAGTTRPFAMNLWVPLEGNGRTTVHPDQYARGLGFVKAYYAELGVEPPALQPVIGHDFREQVQAVLDGRPAAFSFVFGIPPADVLEECRRRGIVTIGTATHVDEAIALEAAGVDLIVASGLEAGGHRTSFLRPVEEAPATTALVPQVVDVVRTPVIAAGGIADGRGVVAMFALGAAAVQVGTAFLVCEESGATAPHRQALLDPGARRTALSRAFSGRHARGIVNRYLTEMRAHEAELPPYPIQGWLTAPLRQAALEGGRSEYLALWSGQNAPLVEPRTAAELVKFLVDDTQRVWESMGRRLARSSTD